MARTLHVLDQPGPTGQHPLLRLSRDHAHQREQEAGERSAWLLIGGEVLRDAARAVGVADGQIRLVARPRRLSLPGAMRRMERLLGGADRVVCWTEGAARWVTGRGVPGVEVRFGQATLGEWARSIISEQADALRADRAASRRAIRERWGVPDSAVMVGLLSDRPEQVDMRRLTLPLAFTHETLDAAGSAYRDVRLVCHPQTTGRLEAIQLAELLALPQMVMQDAGLLEPWHALAGCDLALAPEPKAAGLSIAWAEAMGLPIVAAPEPTLPTLDMVDGRIPTLSAAPKHLAKALTDWAQSLPEPAWAGVASATG